MKNLFLISAIMFLMSGFISAQKNINVFAPSFGASIEKKALNFHIVRLKLGVMWEAREGTEIGLSVNLIPSVTVMESNIYPNLQLGLGLELKNKKLKKLSVVPEALLVTFRKTPQGWVPGVGLHFSYHGK